MSRILKGEIYLADLNPTVGSEIAKTLLKPGPF
jgi:mRNA-degrading endonuclease toxin of MazEF toxin-antitoxin module